MLSTYVISFGGVTDIVEDDVSVGLVGVVTSETVDWGLVSVDVDVSVSDSLGAGSGLSRDSMSPLSA